MTKDEAIKHLSHYKENEELIILWYDKDFLNLSAIGYEKELTEEHWQAVVDKFDGDEFEFVLESLMDKIQEVAREIMEED